MLKKFFKKKNVTVIAKVRAPNGFLFKIEERYSMPHGYDGCGCKYCRSKIRRKPKRYLEEVSVQLYCKNTSKPVGYVNLIRYNPKSFETHSSLDSEYHGKGIGTKMYARAIQWCLENGYKARSSGGSSEMATRVWEGKTLRRYFNIRTSAEKYDGGGTWYAWGKNQ